MMSLQELRDLVAEMRKLGVVEACGVKLGPVPHEALSEQEREELRKKREKAQAEHEKRIAFAATPWRMP